MSDEIDSDLVSQVSRECINNDRGPREVLEAMRDEGYITCDDETFEFNVSIIEGVVKRIRGMAFECSPEMKAAMVRLAALIE